MEWNRVEGCTGRYWLVNGKRMSVTLTALVIPITSIPPHFFLLPFFSFSLFLLSSPHHIILSHSYFSHSYFSRVSFSKVNPSKFDFCCMVSVMRLTTKESAAGSLVNSVSKFLTSLWEVEAGGRNSGSYPLAMTLLMSRALKKGVLFISFAPVGPHPRRSETFRSNMPLNRSFAFSDNCNLLKCKWRVIRVIT